MSGNRLNSNRFSQRGRMILPQRNQVLIFVVVGMLLIFLVINVFIQRSLKNLDESAGVTQTVSVGTLPDIKVAQTLIPAPRVSAPTGEIIRRGRVVPGDDYEESVFYQDGKVIARQKIVRGEIVEQVGNIPDGKIRVEDGSQSSQGEELYVNGKREGVSQLYYKDGTVRKETTYFKGRIVLLKEYFKDGKLHITKDLRDALDISGDTEVGLGKVYYPDGKIRYEWNLTRSARKGFKKAYNQAGEVTMEKYFNERGEEIPQ